MRDNDCDRSSTKRRCMGFGRGWMQTLLLRLLHEQGGSGAQIIARLTDLIGSTHIIKDGAIYTILRRMVDEKIISSSRLEDQRGQTYCITDFGINILVQRLQDLVETKSMFENLIHYYKQHFQGEDS